MCRFRKCGPIDGHPKAIISSPKRGGRTIFAAGERTNDGALPVRSDQAAKARAWSAAGRIVVSKTIYLPRSRVADDGGRLIFLILGSLISLQANFIRLAVSLPLLLWMSPVIAGLVLAIPLGLFTSRRSGPTGWFATPEDRQPPPVVLRANELTSLRRTKSAGALRQLQQDPELLECHLNSLSQKTSPKFGRVEASLATALVKIDRCDSFDEAVEWLDKTEVRAVLNDVAALRSLIELRA